jgi:hypothetical protein
VPIKRPIIRYCVLVFLFAITFADEIPYLHDILRDEKGTIPFFVVEQARDRVNFADEEATRAGVSIDNEILAINGQPYRGMGDWARAFANSPVGENLTVVLRSFNPSHPSERMVLLPVTAGHSDSWQTLADVSLFFLLPAVCVLPGFVSRSSARTIPWPGCCWA